MKNLFLTLAFVLIGSFAFASSNNLKDGEFNATIILVEKNADYQCKTNVFLSGENNINSFNPNVLNMTVEDTCTADISFTMTTTSSSGYLSSVTLTATGVPCDEVGATIKRLRREAWDALTGDF